MSSIHVSRKYKFGSIAVACAIAYPALYMAMYPYWANKKPRPERTIVITRASSDIGKATCYHFASRRCRVIMGCEDMDECRAIRRRMIVDTNNRSLVCRQLDMEDIDSINKFVDEISASEPHVDVLINNTTYKGQQKTKLTKYGVEKHFLQNFLGPYLLTLRLLPKLEQSAEHQRDSRILIHTQKPKKRWRLDLNDISFENTSYRADKAYEQSQLAIAYFANMLEKKLRDQGSKILVLGNGCYAGKHTSIFEDESASFMHNIKTFYTAKPITLTHLSAKLGLDECLELRDSGKLYTYLFQSWGKNKGWGRVSADDAIAPLLWNYAAHLLVNLPQKGAAGT